MRINAVQLSWFRGAAEPVALDLNGKSMAVYGSNGSGKSSFVDAIEYVISNGKIEHLAHEHSGRRQEKAVRNTHTPEGGKIFLSIKFRDGTEHKVKIGADGHQTSAGPPTIAMPAWEYRRTILRQHEAAQFIQSTKGDKYSALLPLLGLQPLERAAENLRQLAKSIEDQSKLPEARTRIADAAMRRNSVFATDTKEEILAKVFDLHTKYCPDKAATTEARTRCEELKTSIAARVNASSADQRRHVALNDAALLDLKAHIDAVRTANGKLAGAVEPLIAEKLQVLESTGAYVDKLDDQAAVNCPACGRPIPVDAFEAHIQSEREKLQGVIHTFNTCKTTIATLCNTVRLLQTTLKKADLKSWQDELADGALAPNLAYLDKIDSEELRKACGEDELKAIEENLISLIDAAASSSKAAPPDAQELSTAKQTVDVVAEMIAAKAQEAAAKRAETLISFIGALEKSTRAEIKAQAKEVIDEISADIQAMWAILHPGEPIDNLQLYIPADADKAVDIKLRFHGVEQDSPRLTLSEGHRNSLGLCIFLAMSKREGQSDRPVFLDDVVVSFDREHRGMIAEILKEHFNTRQVIVLTHDRDWYADLRVQLPGNDWGFKTLLPYESPDLGIRWSHKTGTFDDARSLLKDRPDAAANDARKIMDVELAIVAEKLKLKFPFVRGEKNDRRMAHDFLERLLAEGRKCFQKKAGADYGFHADAMKAIDCANRLLSTWGNRASHSTDVVRPEATALIDACECALGFFTCSSCQKLIWFADAANQEAVQCGCGEIRWRYGKACK